MDKEKGKRGEMKWLKDIKLLRRRKRSRMIGFVKSMEKEFSSADVLEDVNLEELLPILKNKKEE